MENELREALRILIVTKELKEKEGKTKSYKIMRKKAWEKAKEIVDMYPEKAKPHAESIFIDVDFLKAIVSKLPKEILSGNRYIVPDEGDIPGIPEGREIMLEAREFSDKTIKWCFPITCLDR